MIRTRRRSLARVVGAAALSAAPQAERTAAAEESGRPAPTGLVTQAQAGVERFLISRMLPTLTGDAVVDPCTPAGSPVNTKLAPVDKPIAEKTLRAFQSWFLGKEAGQVKQPGWAS